MCRNMLLFSIIILIFGYANGEELSSEKLKDKSEISVVPQKEIDQIKDVKVKAIVQAINEKLAKVKGYTANIERQALDVNGGFDKYVEEHTVFCPDKMFVKGKMVVAHNKSDIGKDLTIVANKNSIFVHFGRIYKKTFNNTQYQEYRENISDIGYLADPFSQYNMEALKLDKETATAWILLAEYKYPNAWNNRITIDKTTGLVKKVEALIKELGDPVILLDVKKISLSPVKIPEWAQDIEGNKK